MTGSAFDAGRIVGDGPVMVSDEALRDIPPTVDGFLAAHRATITRQLLNLEQDRLLSALLFGAPIADRIAARASRLRGGRSRWRYRGAHRTGIHTVDELAADVARQARRWRALHVASLRLPPPGPVTPIWIGTREVRVTFYAPGHATPLQGTLEIVPGDGGALPVRVFPGTALTGTPGGRVRPAVGPMDPVVGYLEDEVTVHDPAVRPWHGSVVKYGLDMPVVDPQPSGDDMTGDDEEVPPCSPSAG